MFQAKDLCLELVRTIIIERRPHPLVFRAIDVLVNSFAYSLKTGSYSKGVKPEKTTVSSVPNNSVSTGPSESVSGVDGTVNNSGYSTSDSEDNANFKKAKAKFLDNNSSSSGNIDTENLVNQPLNANNSEQQESQVTSAAIPPDEVYSFVFASVEEEMITDASYLFAIIVEFIRR